MKSITYKKLILSTLTMAICSSLSAAETGKTEDNAVEKGLDFERIVVTGVSGKGTTVMASTASVSSLTPNEIEIATPRSTSEAFRSIPGIRAESSGGEGNANIAVRGLPVAAGGAKFLQLQEDGLPILQFGDIAFGNSDIFLRLDSTVSSIESIRGGSSSTLASNAPGGIINMISKTGESESGSIATTIGLDYDTIRTDFDFGGEINNSMYFHFGGFYRQGEGPRNTGYVGDNGGQIKANITKEFDQGYVRVYYKYLEDATTGYLPMPMYADGSSLPGFDSQSDAIHSANFTSLFTTDGTGNRRRSDMRDGMNPTVNAVGLEAVFDLGNDWSMENRFRTSSTKGSFTSPFPESIQSSQVLADSIAGSGASLTYAAGPQQGQAYTGDNLMRIHTFDVEMSNLDFMVNDLKILKSFDNTNVTFGYYKSLQNIEQSWLWNTYLSEINGNNASLIDVTAADGTSFSDNGLIAYGVPAWGNCCTRNYDLQYESSAPYIAINSTFDRLTIDASVRYDSGSATGTYAGAVQSTIDMNRDGIISKPEESVSSVNNSGRSIANYDWSYTSYSLGANYILNDDLAIFANLSHGGTTNADRLAFGKIADDGSVAPEDAVDEVDQYELGAKYRQDALALFATAFFAETQEQNFEATSQKFFDRVYESHGIELEGSYYIGDFTVSGNMTWTDAEITQDALNPDAVGNTPRRQADIIYSLTASYNFEEGTAGFNFIGTTDAYAQDGGDQDAGDALKFDGYTQVNAFAQYYLSDSFSVALNVNNLFNVVGLTEAEEGNIPANNIIRARAINGRTTSMTLKYDF
ncbi:TonB-dependent siderophore receptor [Colwellia echini]|uniref:TonB-dependent receptor plug domain-containing protein n=1 Tax=Colwellia echini TaxID=1982103 RepID=A0ABY3MUH2_9GAMM|nr:TonB-dependent receptor [Colwellia echini]TYK64868.1 TonB-dependent receptor plug domain-containing protein [Colwellia echini]